MAKEYQPKKNAYRLPDNLYMRTLYFIRDYERIKKEYHEIINKAQADESDPVTAENRLKECMAIEQAVLMIPEEYRTGVMDSIIRRKSYPDYANKSTWSKYRSIVIYNTAKNMSWI